MPNCAGVFKKIWDGLAKVQEYMLAILSILIAIQIGLLVFFRYVLKINLFGIEEYVIISAWWMYFIGGTYASYERSHITVDVLNEVIKSKKVKGVIQVFNSIMTTFFSAVLAYYSIEFVIWGIEANARTYIYHYPLAYSQSAVLVGFMLMTFYSFVYTIKDIQALLHSEEKTEL